MQGTSLLSFISNPFLEASKLNFNIQIARESTFNWHAYQDIILANTILPELHSNLKWGSHLSEQNNIKILDSISILTNGIHEYR